jgi:hypothetical protein
LGEKGTTVKAYSVGHNISGYLPESDPYVTTDYASAKQVLIDDMVHQADWCDEVEDRHDEAEELTEQYEDVNLLSDGEEWYSVAGDLSYWLTIIDVTEDEMEEYINAYFEEGNDLRCPMAHDYGEVMASFVGFLSAAAESYRYTMRGGSSDNSDLFEPQTMEWAYQNSEALEYAEYDLSEHEEEEEEEEEEGE